MTAVSAARNAITNRVVLTPKTLSAMNVVIKTDPGRRAKVFWATNRYDEVINLSLSVPDNTEVLHYAGLVAKDRGNEAEAISLWRIAVEKAPDQNFTIRSLAWTIKDIDSYKREAINLLEKLVRLGEADGDDFTLLGELQLECGNFDVAHHWLREALKIGTKNESLIYLDLAILHVRLAIDNLQFCEDCGDLDLNTQMSDEEKTDSALRYIYNRITRKVMGNYEG
jgi:tetratricopeptide (TPR) repeat protein